MTARLYVGNLPYSISGDELIQAFQKFGFTVSKPHMVMDRDTGRPKGFAFVEIGSVEEADDAISVMNGALVQGRTLKVDRALERQRSDSRSAPAPMPAPEHIGRGGKRNRRDDW